MIARRYNNNKIRHELIPANAVNELAKVYTVGAEKYTLRDNNNNILDDGADNWKKGMSWKKVIGSVKRHINKFEKGEDFDYDWPEEILNTYGPTYHLANAAWGLLTLLEFYKIHPELDDRNIVENNHKLRIGLDIDGVLADFETAYLEHFNIDNKEHPIDWNDYRFKNSNNFKIIEGDINFWSNIKPIITGKDIDFNVSCYCTARPIDVETINRWLKFHNFPKAPLLNVGLNGNKVDFVKENCDVFIDDSIYNYNEINNNGGCCFLMTRSHNEKYSVGYKRINNIKEIKEKLNVL